MTQPPTAPAQPPQPPGAKPPGKGLAIASLVLGIVGPCTVGLGSLVGIVLGIVALVKMSKAGVARGKGLAIAGLVVSGLGLLLLPVLAILAGILLPAISDAQGRAYQAAFMNRLKQLSTAAQMYASEQDGRLPPPQSWLEELEQQGGMPDLDEMTCAPGHEEAGRAVAMNAGLQIPDPSAPPEARALPLPAIFQPVRTVLFFECAPGSPPAGGPDLLPPEPRYPSGYIIAFCDGHIEAVRPEEVVDLVWEPLQP